MDWDDFEENWMLYYIRVASEDGHSSQCTISLAKWRLFALEGTPRTFLMDSGERENAGAWTLKIEDDGTCYGKNETGWLNLGTLEKRPAKRPA